MKSELQKAITQAVGKATGLKIKPEEIHLEHPEREEYGDYATNIALKLKTPHFTKASRGTQNSKVKSPFDLAEAIVEELKNNETMKQWGHKIQAVRPGFINISIKNEWFIKEMERVLISKEGYGKSGTGKGKTVMVEYAHPNTHKLFHIGHLRNITNGEAIVRILEANGYKVIRANYQGDVGLHIAKCLWAIIRRFKIDDLRFKNLDEKIEFLGRCYVEGNRAYEENEKAKKEILEINKKIYDQSDSKVNKLWQETRQWSLDYFERIYKRVDSHFDRYYFEGEVYQKGKQIVLEGVKKGIFVKSKGAIIFPGSKYGLHDRVFITGEGNPTYEAKDMELGRLQFEEYKPDLIIHNVAPEQREYFKVVFEALAQIYPYTRGKEYHLIYGWVRLKKGKMSSRMGNVVTGEWLLDEAKRKANIIASDESFNIDYIEPKLKNLKQKSLIRSRAQLDHIKSRAESEDVVEQVAVGAVKYSFLKVSPSQDIAFDFDESINLQGNSGPYLQYTYARAKSVLAKAKSKDLRFKIYDLRINDEEKAILRTFYKFPEVVLAAGENYAPNLICNFLYELAQKFNTFYNKHRILATSNQQPATSNLDKDKVQFRLALTAATAQIIKTGLYLLGIKTPEKM